MIKESICQLINQLMRLQTLPCGNAEAMHSRQLRCERLHAELDERGFKGPRPSRQLQRMSIEVIDSAIQKANPMKRDEKTAYKGIASKVYKHIQHGMVMEAALDQALCAAFGDHLVNGAHIESVMHALVGMADSDETLGTRSITE